LPQSEQAIFQAVVAASGLLSLRISLMLSSFINSSKTVDYSAAAAGRSYPKNIKKGTSHGYVTYQSQWQTKESK